MRQGLHEAGEGEEMSRPKLLDLFCGAGGAAMGYYRAGFEVVGIDIEHQRHFPFEFHRADALIFPLEGYDVIHASPPCQAYTKAAKQWRKLGRKYSDLIGVVRNRLKGKIYIIENVPGSPLVNPIILNGAMFDLKIHRIRWFELGGFEIPAFLIPSMPSPIKMGRAIKNGDIIQPIGHFSGVEYARQQMGINWMNQSELADAIPPAYTEFIGKQLMKTLKGTDQ